MSLSDFNDAIQMAQTAYGLGNEMAFKAAAREAKSLVDECSVPGEMLSRAAESYPQPEALRLVSLACLEVSEHRNYLLSIGQSKLSP